MNRDKSLLAFVLVCFLLCTPLVAEQVVVEKPSVSSKRPTLGWVERVQLMPEAIQLDAKLAPAIALSSLHAENIKELKRKGKYFVSFELEDRKGKLHKLELPLVNQRTIINAKNKKHKRQVVKISVCVANEAFDVEVLLSDRSELEQELRLGRDVLAGRFLIDPAKTHTSNLNCRALN